MRILNLKRHKQLRAIAPCVVLVEDVDSRPFGALICEDRKGRRIILVSSHNTLHPELINQFIKPVNPKVKGKGALGIVLDTPIKLESKQIPTYFMESVEYVEM